MEGLVGSYSRVKIYRGKVVDGDEKVMNFIDDFRSLFGFFNDEQSDAVAALFSRGYCYYFAIILKEAFGRGEICMTSDDRHIVWVDKNIAYDINGIWAIFPKTANNGNFFKGKLIPISMLPNYIDSFKHVVPGTTKKGMAERNAVQKIIDAQKNIKHKGK